MTCILNGHNHRSGFELGPRHGDRRSMIAGVPGTGPSVSPVALAGGRSTRSAPRSLADVKDELAGLATPRTRRRSASGAARA